MMLLLLFAGASKLLDLGEFRASLVTWSFLPVGMRGAIMIAVPAVEFSLGALWVLGLWRLAVLYASSVVLALCTATYLIHVIWLEPPRCHCLGLEIAFRTERAESIYVASRNLLFLGCLAIGIHGWGKSGWGKKCLTAPHLDEQVRLQPHAALPSLNLFWWWLW